MRRKKKVRKSRKREKNIINILIKNSMLLYFDKTYFTALFLYATNRLLFFGVL